MKLEAIIDKINEQVQASLYPGASLSVYTEGKWSRYFFGLADPATGEETEDGLVYDLASVSKVVGVGTLMLELLREKRLTLDVVLFPDAYPHLTLRHYLTHTTGLDPFIPGRDAMGADELRQALLHLQSREDQDFHYTDVNFLLMGFYLEDFYGQYLAQVCENRIFKPWLMSGTSFGPVPYAVPTVQGVPGGTVHDPKARVLGNHAGSAGIFSTVSDLEIFVGYYLKHPEYEDLVKDYTEASSKPRSLAWNLEGDWLDHTGYTGTFAMFSRERQEAAIFLANRTYWEDDRAYWIERRNELMDLIRDL